MPVFHTKTIESILEPVAQQVSKLVILHEEAEDGNAMPDLARPVQAVKMAVDNLVKVGYETIANSEDAFLKHDMPPALNRVEEASLLLLDASGMLRDDPFSAPARKKLIEGSRGILQGTSALLLAFDESEVRKIVRICKNVLEYLAITEVVESMSDLVTFVKNLSPILTRMTKEVDAREKELTHQVHRQWLIRSLDQVKTLTPVLISAIKIYLTTRDVGGQGLTDAQANRDYTVNKMSTEIHEIIRVLQLTTYDEDEWDADDMTVMKKAQNAISGRMKLANDWLLESNAPVGSSGERCLRQILEDAHRVAERCVNEEDRGDINKLVSDITSMADALCELRQQGKGTSPQGMALARGMQDKLRELQDKVNTAVVNTDKSGVRKPAHTMSGKAEQAQRWLANPGRNDQGLGEESTRMMIAEGRRAAEFLQGNKRADLQRSCDEVEMLTNQLSELCRRGMGDSAQARAVAANLSQKLHSLKNKIQDALTVVVADDFLDITTPLKQLSDAAFAPVGSPDREAKFEDRARRFDHHSAQLSQTARMAARAGKSTNKDTIEGIQDMANQVEDLTPQVIKAARIMMFNPDNQAATEHFELLKKQWSENVERLRNYVDEVVDTAAFVRAQEEGILRDTELAESAVKTNDAFGVVNHTSSIARRANRVLQVAQQELENSEDPLFVDRVNDASRMLRNTITPMVQNAKALAQDPRNPGTQNAWRTTNQRLINAVGDVRSAVTVENEPDYSAPQAFSATPDMSQLSISATQHPSGNLPYASLASPPPGGYGRQEEFNGTRAPYQAPPRPPLPRDNAPPRPPPPETDDEEEREVFSRPPQENQPIMMAAHALHMDVKEWSSRDNEIIGAAKRMAIQMAKLSQLVRGEGGSKKDLIDVAKRIAESSEEVTRLAKELAKECTDKRMRLGLLQVCERIPTIGTQLKILSTVKATMLGAQESSSEEDQEATEMLVGNAQNLMQSVRETVRAAQAASIKIRVDSGYSICWTRKRPWYT